jgi:hypothetical protein
VETFFSFLSKRGSFGYRVLFSPGSLLQRIQVLPSLFTPLGRGLKKVPFPDRIRYLLFREGVVKNWDGVVVLHFFPFLSSTDLHNLSEEIRSRSRKEGKGFLFLDSLPPPESLFVDKAYQFQTGVLFPEGLKRSFSSQDRLL